MGKMNLKLSPIAQRRVAQVLLVLAAVMAVDSVYQLGMHVTWRRWVSRQAVLLAKANSATSQPTTQAAKKDKGPRPTEIAEALRKRNIFTKPKPTGHGVNLTGVFFNYAMFSTREGGTVTVKEGESGAGIKVKSIDGYSVTIEYQGKPETMNLFAGGGGGGGRPGGMPTPGGEAVMMRPEGMPANIQMQMPSGMDMSSIPPEVREKLERRMRRQAK